MGGVEAVLSSTPTWFYVLGTPEPWLLEQVHNHPSSELALLEGAVGAVKTGALGTLCMPPTCACPLLLRRS